MILVLNSPARGSYASIQQALREQGGSVRSFYELKDQPGLLIGTFGGMEDFSKISEIVDVILKNKEGNHFLVPCQSNRDYLRIVSPEVEAWVRENDLVKLDQADDFTQLITPTWDALIGRDKQKVQAEQIIAMKRMRALFKSAGQTFNPMPSNVLLYGNRGCGKNAFAIPFQYMLSDELGLESLYVDLRILKNDFFVEAKDNLKEKLNQTKGGVLILRNLDVLAEQENMNSEGTLLSFMLDTISMDPGRTHIIATTASPKFATYAQKNDAFRDAFPYLIQLPDFTVPELTKMFDNKMAANHIRPTVGVLGRAKDYFEKAKQRKGTRFQNGHEVDILFERSLDAMAVRQADVFLEIAEKAADEPFNDDQWATLAAFKASDIPRFGHEHEVANVPSPHLPAKKQSAESNVVQLFKSNI